MLSAAKASASADETAVFVTAILGSASETIGTLRVPDTYLLHQRHRPSPVGEATAQDVRDQPLRHVLQYGRFKVETSALLIGVPSVLTTWGSSASSWSPEGEFPRIRAAAASALTGLALSEQGLHTPGSDVAGGHRAV